MSKSTTPLPLSIWLDRFIIFWLFVFAFFAPHSIAVTQGAWLIGILLWVIRFFVYPPPTIHRSPLDYALLGFFILTGISALLSYQPLVSIGKLRGATLFTIVYLFSQNIPTRRVVRLLAITLIASCMVNVVYEAGARIVGRGVKVQEVRADSPLTLAVPRIQPDRNLLPIRAGDTVLEVDGQKVRDPAQIVNALSASQGTRPALIQIYRSELYMVLRVPRGRLLSGDTAEQRLGIAGWSRGRDWRATGFYDHWVTYSEVLQLIASLALGLFVFLPRNRSWSEGLLLLALAGFGFALLMTVTRASWLGFSLSAATIFLLGTSRRTSLIVAGCALPLILLGLFLLHQKRNVAFIDPNDASTTWRETVWREGFDLLISKPRHLLVGVGMDSIKSHWREWGLFDEGRLPVGHMHSDLLQIALERGLPTLLVWLILLGTYARALWRVVRGRAGIAEIEKDYWLDRGIALGALGGLIGFFSSGLVHYNWGDSEVVMVLYFIMGLCLFIHRAWSDPKARRGFQAPGEVASSRSRVK